jgi:methylated-DNA-[protein]-cysteine S-methyltransferase
MSSSTKAVHALATAQTTLQTPLGPLLLARTAQGLAGAWFEGQKDHPGSLAAPQQPADLLLMNAAAQLTEYFEGKRQEFDLPLDLHGTEFQCGVWRALLKIDTGKTQSYGDIARAVNSPKGVRAVGSAVGKNPLSVIVPCHRVMGSDGSLTGYAGGLDRKRALLRLEGVRLQEQLEAQLEERLQETLC